MSVLVTTVEGCHHFGADGECTTSFAGHRVEGMAAGPGDARLAVVDRTEIWSYDRDGEWSPVATARSGSTLTAVAALGDTVFAGTADARVLRLDPSGALRPLPSFDSVPGREQWHAVGIPLQVRSMTTTADASALLVNVHVGGIPRSVDAGETWHPTIDVDADVHQVLAHPTRADVAVAAASAGLCRSTDGGATWTSTTEGMELTYARGVAILGDDVLVTVSDGPWAERSAVYRAAVDGGAVTKVTGGLPDHLRGNVDTRCIASDGARVVLADGEGDVWLSAQGDAGFVRLAERLRGVTGVAFA
jgi:hypothetical protein